MLQSFSATLVLTLLVAKSAASGIDVSAAIVELDDSSAENGHHRRLMDAAPGKVNATNKLSYRLSDMTVFAINNYSALLSMESSSSSIGKVTAVGNITCGDGTRQGGEQCDDGNLHDGDGCSKLCKVEGGYACEPKLVGNKGDKCYACKPKQCSILYNRSFRCMSTTRKKTQGRLRAQCSQWEKLRAKLKRKGSVKLIKRLSKKKDKLCAKLAVPRPAKTKARKHLPIRHVRGKTGFCKCGPDFCKEIDGAGCKSVGQGWYADAETRKCKCGLGFCLLPYGQQTLASPRKFHCAKLNKNMIRNSNTSECECAPASPSVSSYDPAKAKRLRSAACKAPPSTPLKQVPHTGPIYGAFTCMGHPYVKGNSTDDCSDCAPSACKMPRVGITTRTLHPDGSNANQTNPFYCAPKTVMEALQMTRGSDGMCKCAENECLKPHRDSFKCVAIDSSHPYGGVKLVDGKCGCTSDAHSCIMPTHPAGLGTPSSGFQCLKLKSGGAKTRFGERYFRGKTGLCKCVPSRCRADPMPSNVGAFRCIDMEKNGAYAQDPVVKAAVKAGTSKEEDMPCRCARGACAVPGETKGTSRCIKCPTRPGACRTRCSPDGNECVKYCSTKHVKLQHAPGKGVTLGKKGKIARVIRCFITKTVNCKTTKTATARKSCSQKISARAIFDCPGKWSYHSNRKLIDGTYTHGFTSVCSQQNFECQRRHCDITASAAVCLEKMMLS